MNINEFLASHPVFTRAEFAAAHPDGSANGPGRAVDKALAYHAGTGRLARVRQGLYVVVPPGQTPEQLAVDAYLVASRLAPDAVLCHHTALELHGVAQSVLQRLTVCTSRDLRPTVFRGMTYVGVRPSRATRQTVRPVHVMTVNRQGLDVRVTDMERSVVDSLDRLELAGGWEEVLRSLEHVRVLDAERAADYALALGRAATAAKLGLFLDSHREELFVDESVLDRLRAARPKRTHVVERRRGGRFRSVRAWRLSVPEALFDPTWAELR